MSERRERHGILERCLGKPAAAAELVDYAEDSIVSKTIIDKPVGTITLFAFDKGQKLSEHSASYDAVVEVLDGRGELTIGGKPMTVSAGQIIVMPANVSHAVAAKERFKMMLVMIRA